MKKLLLAFAAGVCLSACATHDPKISIVPYPNHLEPGHGTFAVKGEGATAVPTSGRSAPWRNSPHSWRKPPAGRTP